MLIFVSINLSTLDKGGRGGGEGEERERERQTDRETDRERETEREESPKWQVAGVSTPHV